MSEISRVLKLVVLVLFASAIQLCVVSAQVDSIDSMLKASGASEADIAKVKEAFNAGSVRGDWKPLEALLDHEAQPVAAFAGGILIENGQADAVVRHLKSRGKHFPALLMLSGALPTLDWLDVAVAELSATESDEDSRRIAQVGLSAVSGEKFTDAREWEDWLKGKRSTFEQSGVPQPDPRDFIELTRTAFAEKRTEDFREAIAESKHDFEKGGDAPANVKAAKVIDAIDNMFGQALDAREAGATMERSADAKAGDRFFRHSEFQRAVVAYGRAVELEPDDDRSRYLGGVALFEAGQLDAASALFAELAKRSTEADAAAFMAKVASDKDIAAIGALAVAERILKQERPGTKKDEEPDFDALFTGGWKFPVLKQLTGAAMVEGESIASIDQEPVLEAIAESAALQDWRGMLGAAFCLPRDQRLSYFIEAARQFQDRPEVLAAAISVAGVGLEREKTKAVEHELFEKFAACDPDNFIAQLLMITRDVKTERPADGKRTLDSAVVQQLHELAAGSLEPRSYLHVHQAACDAYLQSVNHPFRRQSRELASLLDRHLTRVVVALGVLRKSETLTDIECADRLTMKLIDSQVLGPMEIALKLSQIEIRTNLKAAYVAAGQAEKAEKIVVPDKKALLSMPLEISPLLKLCVPSIERAINESGDG
ncbi:MAG: tetratricopeptide repeat protein [Verrucomicrobiae bacterium]|nr:tetratricopeptide repeat protein [Verrucomicrobiae bacterium]